MLALRILMLPIVMAAFAAFYVVATKAPEAVEMVNTVIWLLLPILMIAKLGRPLFNSIKEN